jgi:hypothetical protein
MKRIIFLFLLGLSARRRTREGTERARARARVAADDDDARPGRSGSLIGRPVLLLPFAPWVLR